MTEIQCSPVPKRVKDLTGVRFARWTVVGFAFCRDRYSFWTCKCDCGTVKVIRRNALTPGKSTSCGCRAQETLAMRTTHGLSHTSEYTCWESMMTRCTCETHSNWKNYGGRGIKVCERWRSFENFYADMGPRPTPQHSIERVNNDGHYEPGNCRWATKREQCNNHRGNRLVTVNGETKTLATWIDELSLPYNTILYRLRRGWDEAKALLTPVAKRTA